MKKVLTILLAMTLVFTLAGCKKEVDTEDADNVADATQKLSLDVDALAVTSNIDLPLTALHDAVVSWSSSNTDVIANDGTVTRPAVGTADATVVLTATVTIGDETLTKEITVKVLVAVPTDFVTIAEFIDVSEVGDVVEVTGIVTGTIVGKGFHITDGTRHTYVYQGIEPVVAIGDEVTVSGTKTVYYNIPEVTDVTNVVVNSSGNTLPAFVDTTIADIYLEDNEDSLIYNTMVSFTGVVELVGDYDNVYIYWVNANYEKIGIEVYYKSGSEAKIDEIAALEGKLVTVDAILMDYYSQGWWRISVNTPGDVTELTMTEQQEAEYAAGALDLGDTTEVDGDLDLPLTGMYTSTIAWASDTEAVVATDGTVMGALAESDVVLTATITVGAASVTKTFDLHVLDAASIPLSVMDALALTDGTVVAVVGVVTGFYYDEPMIQDEDGTAIYVNSAIVAEVGDEIVVTGELSTYDSYGNSQRRLDDALLVEIRSSENDLFIFDTYTVDEVFTLYPATSSQRIKLTNAVIATLDDGFGYTFIASGTQNIKFKFPVYWDTIFAELDVIPEITFNVVDISYDNLRVSSVLIGGLTEAESMIAAKMTLSVADAVVEDIDLVTELPEFGATITWASDTEAVIDAMGVVTRPDNGDGDATVVLTASVTVGATTETVDFTVVVAEKALPTPDVFISEIIEGSGNNKAIEIYNPTGAAIDLTLYTLAENYGSGENTYDLTGSLASGETFVLCADAAEGVALLAGCDVLLAYPSVAHFNGNDSIALLKDGKVIDQFGVPAEAGGSDFHKDVTLVRNADVAWGAEIYDVLEWTEYPTDTFDYIGSHVSDFPAAPVPNLFFSEYGEPGGGSCKYVEIYNPTDAAIDLTGWTISSPDEGDAFDTDYRVDVLTGSILPGEVLVVGAAVCIDGSDSGSFDAGFPQTLTNFLVSSGNATAYFNGDDALGLFNGDVLIDMIGNVGEFAPDAGTDKDSWAVGNGDLLGGVMENTVMIRIPSVTYGTVDWSVGAMQWIVKDHRDYTDVGTHTVD